MAGKMLTKHHITFLLCVIHKNKRANLTSNFVDENFLSKEQKTAIIKIAVFVTINQINLTECHPVFLHDFG